jgi:hypothetical protein
VARIDGGGGTLWLDSVSLLPGDAVHGLFRRDLFDALAGLSPAFGMAPCAHPSRCINKYLFICVRALSNL